MVVIVEVIVVVVVSKIFADCISASAFIILVYIYPFDYLGNPRSDSPKIFDIIYL